MTTPPEAPRKTMLFDDAVLEKIAGKAAMNVPGVLALQGNLIENLSDRLTDGEQPQIGVAVDANQERQTVALELTALLAYGKRAEAIFDQLVDQITRDVKTMTGFQITQIKLRVKDLLTKEEWAQAEAKRAGKKSKKES
ncbi:Asp23/Gls24 family envelope stress response protein [Levilactobacillus namurensis]|uniref:Asp23/Gls24 family envelope stress response protein n=1 Tax=Levilactobacillus namurensis TaxID=380393 RepID=UPI0026F34269|nr:Asp23/Gls24 family envelope stress response protein [Levilactobacillus namurensis]